MAKRKENDPSDFNDPNRLDFGSEDPQQKPAGSSDSSQQKGWKGFEEVEEEEDPVLTFGKKRETSEEDDLDMTPMVDVTFLLLIFFMVTASFTLQKSFQQAQTKTDKPSTTVEEPLEDVKDYVEVIIDQTNTFYVVSRDEEVEAPTVREMRAKVRDAKESLNAKRMVITAHADSKHSQRVAAWDAAQAANLSDVETRVTEEDF